ncbi:hypothetical protein D3C72_1978820 [compost metagenome]
MPEHRRTDDPGTGGIGTDMANPGNQPVTDLAAQGQTEIVGRHERTDPEAVDMIGSQAQGQVSTQQAGTNQHHQRSEIQRAKRLPDLSHQRPERPLEQVEKLLESISEKNRVAECQA